MVMAVNNAPLLGQLADFSNLKNDFDKGQAIRSAWDNRQAQKAMNGLSSIDDYNERLKQARKHRLAGLLVPKVQEYEEARQKASLDNLKASSDIQKTYADIGKTGAETTEINAKSAGNLQSMLAKAGLTGNKKIFNNMLYDFYNRGLMDKEQVASWVRLGETGDRATFQQLAMGDVDIAKAFKPSLETTDLGNRVAINEYNPLSGDFNSLGEYDKGLSPDNVLDNQTQRYGYAVGLEGKKYTANRNYEGRVYSAAMGYKGRVYTADRGYEGRVDSANISNQPKLKPVAMNGLMWLFNPATGGYQRMTDPKTGKQLLDTKGKNGANSANEEKIRLDRVDTVTGEIEKILSGKNGDTTGSWIGAGIDGLSNGLGIPTQGAKNTAKLKSLGGQLVALMPKMSGPQSDKDVQMYREMAGNLSDPTASEEVRLEALKTIKALNNKYRSMQESSGYANTQAQQPTQQTTQQIKKNKRLSKEQKAQMLAQNIGIN